MRFEGLQRKWFEVDSAAIAEWSQTKKTVSMWCIMTNQLILRRSWSELNKEKTQTDHRENTHRTQRERTPNISSVRANWIRAACVNWIWEICAFRCSSFNLSWPSASFRKDSDHTDTILVGGISRVRGYLFTSGKLVCITTISPKGKEISVLPEGVERYAVTELNRRPMVRFVVTDLTSLPALRRRLQVREAFWTLKLWRGQAENKGCIPYLKGDIRRWRVISEIYWALLQHHYISHKKIKLCPN